MDKIGSAIQRVNYPGVFIIEVTTTLFSQNSAAGQYFLQAYYKSLFGCFIHIRNKVIKAFFLDIGRIESSLSCALGMIFIFIVEVKYSYYPRQEKQGSNKLCLCCIYSEEVIFYIYPNKFN